MGRKVAKQKVRFMIVGNNEVLGLEEVLTRQEKWMSTVTCYSSVARAYFFDRDDFLRLIE